MKSLLILLFVAYGAADPLEDGLFRVKRSVDHVHNMVLNERLRLPQLTHKRTKRQVGWRSIDNQYDESTLCILDCANQLQRAAAQYKIEDQTGSSSTGANKILKPTVDLTRLNTVCTAMRPPVQCFDRCSNSDLKTKLQISLEPIRFICIDRFQDFMNNLRCMHKLDATASAQCNPRCRRFEAAVNKTVQMGQKPFLRQFYSASELKDMISGTCQFVQCYTDCSVPMTRSVCGDTAAELASGLIRKMFASIQNYDTMSNAESILPASCRRLAGTSIVEDDDEGDVDETPLISDTGANSWRDRSNQGDRMGLRSNRRYDDDATIILVVPEDDSIEV